MFKASDDLKADDFHDENVEEIDPIAEKKLIRKIDLHLMPSVFILYLFSYVVGTHVLNRLKCY